MSKPIDVFVLRHAAPLDNGLYDPGIGVEQIPRIKNVAEMITEISGDDTEFTIYSSPRAAAIQTGNVLRYSKTLKIARKAGPTIHDDLSDHQMASYDMETKKRCWTAALQEMSGRAIMQTATDKNTGLIIITHKPVMCAFPVDGLLPHTGYLALNHFKDYQASPPDKVTQTSQRTNRFIRNGRALQSIVFDFIRENPEFLDEDNEPPQELFDELDEITADLRAKNEADLKHYNSSQT